MAKPTPSRRAAWLLDRRPARIAGSTSAHSSANPGRVVTGGRPAPRRDGERLLPEITEGRGGGRPFLALGQWAWSCRRSLRFGRWLLIRTDPDGLREFPQWMLLDIARDPHETRNLADQHPAVLGQGLRPLDQWYADMTRCADDPADPMWQVLAEGGPFHTLGQVERDLPRLRETGRLDAALRLEARYPRVRQG